MATLRLPSGATRAVAVAAIEPAQARSIEDLEVPRPDFRELWKRREWLRALLEPIQAARNTQAPKEPEGSDNGQGHPQALAKTAEPRSLQKKRTSKLR